MDDNLSVMELDPPPPPSGSLVSTQFLKNNPFGDIGIILFDTLNRHLYTPGCANRLNHPQVVLPRLGVAKRGRCWQWCQVPESSFQVVFQTFQICFCLKILISGAFVLTTRRPNFIFLCLLVLSSCILFVCVSVCVRGGWVLSPIHRHPCVTLTE